MSYGIRRHAGCIINTLAHSEYAVDILPPLSNSLKLSAIDFAGGLWALCLPGPDINPSLTREMNLGLLAYRSAQLA